MQILVHFKDALNEEESKKAVARIPRKAAALNMFY